MELVNFSSPDPGAYLACDEVLLLQAEAGRRGETLRFAEIASPAVVMGVGAVWREEVRGDACRADGVPLLRRCSGGGTVLVARGCLNYSAVLDMEQRPELRSVRASYRQIVPRLAAALSRDGMAVRHAGLCDLAWENRKVGGCAQKRKRRWLLHHGTLLYDMELAALDRYLGRPPRPPDYRRNRPHSTFASNLPHRRAELMRAVRATFGVDEHDCPTDLTEELSEQVSRLAGHKYRSDEWAYRR
ncbi:MAG: lipoate--protein ligase family protein [Candidatus Brocadiia bacterium]